MATIANSDWNSISDYDESLKAINHYKMHPEMLPFIGKHYPHTRILILGESHYLSNEETDENKELREWYERPISSFSFKWPGNINTRGVVHNYLIHYRTKAHSMFRNPAKCLIDSWNLQNINDSEAFTAFSFLNYFQIPANASGRSINLTDEDEKNAATVLADVIRILEPIKVVFLSKKAFDSYCRKVGEVDLNLIDYVNHPTCSHWNNENGGIKLCKLFSNVKTKSYDVFSKNGFLELSRTEDILKNSVYSYKKIEKKQKRFLEDQITYRVYADDPMAGNSVNEIVWRLADGADRFGIGYVVSLRYLWIWNYVTESFINIDEIEKGSKLDALYYNVLKLVELL